LQRAAPLEGQKKLLPLPQEEPRARRINSLFGDYLGVPLSDKDSACSSQGCYDVEQ
jgi:hypothetical protein